LLQLKNTDHYEEDASPNEEAVLILDK